MGFIGCVEGNQAGDERNKTTMSEHILSQTHDDRTCRTMRNVACDLLNILLSQKLPIRSGIGMERHNGMVMGLRAAGMIEIADALAHFECCENEELARLLNIWLGHVTPGGEMVSTVTASELP